MKTLIKKKEAKSPIQTELEAIAKAEEKLRKQACAVRQQKWQTALEQKIPEKIHNNLQLWFAKAFGIIFEKGESILSRTFDSEAIAKEFDILDYAVDKYGTRKDIRKLKRAASQNNSINTLITTVEGIGLGALGIGLPDIVIWLGFLIRGVYEIALKYGFPYDTPEEQYFQLKLIETALNSTEEWKSGNNWVDTAITTGLNTPGQEELKLQIEQTSNAFADDLLIAKFVQGFAVIGAAGGLVNPIYYKKILKYVELKYRKRYFSSKQ